MVSTLESEVKDTQQWVTKGVNVPGPSFMTNRLQIRALVEFMRKGYNSFSSSDKS